MADESPSEREERLQQQEERLQRQHERLMEKPPVQGGKSGGVGKFFGGLAAGFGEHKVAILAVVGIAIVLFVIIQMKKGSSAGPGNQQGSLQSYPTADVATAIDQLTQQQEATQNQLTTQQGVLGNLLTAIQNIPTSGNNSNNTQTTATNSNSSSSSTTNTQPAPDSGSQYVTVTQWPSAFGSLSGIAQAEGISLSRIESLNPQLYNQQPGSGFNLIYPGQRVRIA